MSSQIANVLEKSAVASKELIYLYVDISSKHVPGWLRVKTRHFFNWKWRWNGDLRKTGDVGHCAFSTAFCPD